MIVFSTHSCNEIASSETNSELPEEQLSDRSHLSQRNIYNTPFKHDDCQLDLDNYSGNCTFFNVTSFVQIENTVLEGNCGFFTDYPVTYDLTVCYNNLGILTDITITHLSVDYNYLALDCPDFELPNDPAQLEEVLIQLERELGNAAEIYEFGKQSSNAIVDCSSGNKPVSLTRIASACFQFCWIPPNDPNQLYGPTKVLCPGDICCFQSRTYCMQDGEIIRSEAKSWNTGNTCNFSSDCNEPISDSCEHDCGVVF